MPCLILQATVLQDKCEVTFMIHLQKFSFSKCILTIRFTFCCICTTCVYVCLPPMYNEFSILQVFVVPDCPQGGVRAERVNVRVYSGRSLETMKYITGET